MNISDEIKYSYIFIFKIQEQPITANLFKTLSDKFIRRDSQRADIQVVLFPV
jgi:hypothetical protein